MVTKNIRLCILSKIGFQDNNTLMQTLLDCPEI